MQVDVLIIGNGIAALSAALNLPDRLDTLLITKATGEGCNSHWAQGGVAAPADENDIPSHIRDTLDAGAGRCDEKAVRRLIEEGLTTIRDLVIQGMPFDRDEKGEILLTKEAAHSRARILHAGGDATGQKIHTFLAGQNRRRVLTGVTVVDLLIENGRCYGACVEQDGVRRNLYAHDTIIATGGFGGLYEVSTNAPGMMGELQGIAADRGCELKDMHFTQFHPTVFTGTDAPQKPLLTEALRGEGALIVDETGRRFLLDADDRGELAPRDVVSRAVYAHRMAGHEVFLDLSGFDAEYFKTRFPTVYGRLVSFGYHPPADRIPISPAFHYAMGGIATDENARVLNTAGLYAVGEVACSGVHGANRLASNSLLEALVFGRIAAQAIAQNPSKNPEKPFGTSGDSLYAAVDSTVIAKIRSILWQYAGIVRTAKGLKTAQNELAALEAAPMGVLMRKSLTTAQAIVDQAIACPISVGAHYLQKENLE